MQANETDVIFTAAEIDETVRDIASKLNEQCDGEWMVLCVLTGGMVFTTDLVRYLDFPVVLEFMRVSRYHDKTEGQDLQWFAKPRSSLAGKNILLVDDIFDEGKTLAALRDFCYAEGAAKVVTVVLLDKEHDRRQVTYLPDLVGRVCPDRFVFGYGMDYEGLYRNWPAIHALPIE